MHTVIGYFEEVRPRLSFPANADFKDLNALLLTIIVLIIRILRTFRKNIFCVKKTAQRANILLKISIIWNLFRTFGWRIC